LEARRVLKWYNRFYNRYPFVIAIQAKERFPPKPWAEIGPAARDLSGFGFKIIVDASPHALPEKETEREEYVDIDFMSKDLLFQISDFHPFFHKLESSFLTDEVWHIIGGDPNQFQRLVNACIGKDAIDEFVVDFLFSRLQDTSRALDLEILRFPSLREVLKGFRYKDSIGTAEFPVQFSDVKCLRVIHNYMVPSNPTIAFLLRIGLDGFPLNAEIKSLSLKEKREKLKAMVTKSLQ
jgi:hypothetical protein